MPSISDHDNKVFIKDNTDVEVFSIPDASAKTTYTVVAPATTTVAAVATTRAASSSPSVTFGFSTATQANNLIDAVNQLVNDLKAFKVVT